jgi:hypothetical protein
MTGCGKSCLAAAALDNKQLVIEQFKVSITGYSDCNMWIHLSVTVEVVRHQHFGTGTASVPWHSVSDLYLTKWHWIKYVGFPAATTYYLHPLLACGMVAAFDAASPRELVLPYTLFWLGIFSPVPTVLNSICIHHCSGT